MHRYTMFYKLFSTFLFIFPAIGNTSIPAELDIEIIAPSSGVSEEIARQVEKITGKSVKDATGNSQDQIFKDETVKFKVLDRSLRSKHKILWALRGGYGVDKIMPHVVSSDYTNETKKIIIGYSDLTPLMIHMSQKYGWTAINAPMLKDFATNEKSEESYTSIVKFLKGKNQAFNFSDLVPLNKLAENKSISGKITGGNLTCIVSTIGTKWQIDTANRIIFLEDTNIQGHYLDRLLTHMNNAGLFSQAKAIVLGNFGTGCDKILKTFATKLDIPVYKSNSFGHQKKNLPFGYEFRGDLKAKDRSAMITMKPRESHR